MVPPAITLSTATLGLPLPLTTLAPVPAISSLSVKPCQQTILYTSSDAIIGHDVVVIVLPDEHVLDGAFIIVGAKAYTMTCSEQISGMCSIETIRGTIQISSVH